MAFEHHPQKLNNLQADILRTILYFDIFSYPLTYEELYRFLPSNSTSPDRIREACLSEPLNKLLRQEENFIQLNGRPSFIAGRLKGEARAVQRLRTANVVARLISYLPFVQGVFLSGELSKGVSSEDSDLDFVIVTSPRRVWIVRAMLTALKRTLLLGSRRFLCLNYIVSTEHLQTEDQSLFSAIEIVTLKPLAGHEILDRFLSENSWVREQFPNAVLPKRANQIILADPAHKTTFLSRLDDSLMRTWERIWLNRYPSLSPQQRSHQFRCLPHLSTAWGVDQQERILTAYRERLTQFDLLSP